ncbi:MAG: hypothetical protein LBK62_13690 [Treponema sp.]|jgi:hypothetical protein|nr:hypothetical protein [Treponema sp.]
MRSWAVFDVSKNWVILAPASVPAAWNAVDELAFYIGLLRDRAGLGKNQPPVEDAETASPLAGVPIILIGVTAAARDRNGFAWRIGQDRIEIQGDSIRGLWNAVFSFLSTLNIRWPEPEQEELPPPPTAGVYPLGKNRNYCHSASSVQDRRRLIVDERLAAKERALLIRWAARNQYDALIFSLAAKGLWNKARSGRGIRLETERYALILEAGGRDLSYLLPRRLFFFHQNMFRMDYGRRVKEHHFCATNPKTIRLIKITAEKLFVRAMAGMNAQPFFRSRTGSKVVQPPAVVPVFHLWPDRDHERTWCACPACRAFSPEEQNRIAINSVADVLAGLDPQARLSYFEAPAEISGNPADVPAVSIAPRANTFSLSLC